MSAERPLSTSSSAPAATGADRPVVLAGDRVWRVCAGQINVFTVRLAGGRPVGPRTHLLQARAGQALFGFGPSTAADGWRLLAVGAPGTNLAAVERSAFLAEAPGAVAALVEPWVEGIYASLTRDKLPAISLELKTGEPTDVEPGTSVRVPGELAWVRHLRGRSRLMGREGLPLDGESLVPVSRHAWLLALEDSRVAALDTADLASADLWDGLAALQRLVLGYAAMQEEAADEAARRRLLRRAAAREAVLRDACERLAATMATRRERVPPAADGGTGAQDVEDPLFAASALVAHSLGIVVRPGPRSQGGTPRGDRLESLLRASRVRARRVALRDDWWRHDNGPLLATRRDGQRPVALLRGRPSGPYELHDPATRAVSLVDGRAAEALEPFAHSFYRPFPEKPLGVRDVVRFGLRGCRRDVGVLVGVGFCTALLAMVPSLATGALFNTVIPGAQRSQLVQVTLVLLSCAVAMALVNLAQSVAVLRIEGRAGAALQCAVWDRLLGLPLNFFRPYTSGDLAVRAMSVDTIRQVVSGATVTALLGGILALGNVALMYWYSWRLALWASAIIGVVIVVTVAGGWLQLRPERDALRMQSKAAGIVLQLLTGIAKIRVAGVEVHAFALWARRFSKQRRLQYRGRWISNWVSAFNGAVPVLANVIVFAAAVPLMGGRGLGTGDFLAFLAAFSSSTGALIGTSLALLAALSAVPLYEQAKPILETVPEVDPGKADPGVLTGDIEIQHAVFRYQHDGPIVLRDLSLRVRPGEFVAVVGPSGSGKSTLLRLLLGFEKLEAGAIYFDGQDLGGLDIHAVRRQIGVVLQSGRMMTGDIFTNIAGSGAASLQEAWDAARMAGLAEDIEAMPMGMHTVISEGGGTLSGGQRQRMLIARAIVNRPRVLLFDEATSALDNRTQAIVSSSLEQLQATRIVVAHRLSTIRNADRIFVVERGRLVQSGSYADLIAEEGPFAELARRQIA